MKLGSRIIIFEILEMDTVHNSEIGEMDTVHLFQIRLAQEIFRFYHFFAKFTI